MSRKRKRRLVPKDKKTGIPKKYLSGLKGAKTRKNITYGQLVKVYRRGQGAWLSGGSRPRIPMAAWSMARVNSFLRGSRKHDTDLRRKRKR